MPYYLLYDDRCPFCVGFKEGVKKRDIHNRIIPIGFQDPRIAQIAPGMSEEKLLGSFHLVFPNGKIVSGNRVLPDLLDLLPHLKLLSWLFRLPGTPWLGDHVYAWVAAHRKRI